ncbi:efflux transporter outer membrane subunit [Lichenihabitans sp. Uapishka_5]|uniref:efflux transporter outer membrane subunit n=1 Tax=Lichenihabitans sp. Uapishka_5 TaxID=3037302 RepID=UPI0029E7F9B6|nr:efflux transporter outer membrane subunit [Lichenihabitans sp. Uapishka_5]MDX7952019.1 efflux transporter outer membrane subunit [Lichenihabitans sp. Uapishka_5]
MHKLRPLLAGTAALALVGCTVGPDFVAPLPAMVNAQTFLDNGATTPVRTPLPVLRDTVPAEPDAEWWRVFRDPILTRLEARVADQNLDVRTATFRIAESRAQLGTAAAAALPTINGTGFVNRQQYSQNGIVSLVTNGLNSSGGTTGTGSSLSGLTSSIGEPFTDYQVGFDASWELDLWGRVRRNVESATAQVDSSAEMRRDTLVSALAELARDYVQLRGTQDMIRISQANIQVNQDILNVVRTRQQRGLVTGLDVSSAAQQVEAIEAQLPQLKQQEILQVNAIGLILGQPPMALSAELLPSRPVPPVPPRVPVGVPSDLIRRRPDIRRAEADLHAAVAQIGVAVASFFPTVSITASPSLNALDPGNVFKANSLQYMNIGPSVSLPIFEGGRLKSNLVLQQARQQEAAVSYQKAVLQAWNDVVNALASLKGDEGRRARLSRQVVDARQALSLARTRYATGVDTFTTVLQNSQTLLGAEMNLSQATAAMSTDLVALYKALGGGWQGAFPPPPGPPPVLPEVAPVPVVQAGVN